jgi:ABC-type sugar transport system ATPase subunit
MALSEVLSREQRVVSDKPILELRKATKVYQGVPAIKDVDFTLYPGEVHALVGENGAGKSTLCKIISGAVTLDGGEMLIDGQAVNFSRPRDALERGIAMVYQETSLVDTMTVAQNIELGHESLLTRYRSLNIKAQVLLQSMNFNVDPTAKMGTLGAAKKQMVEIARALRAQARVVIFDEPTAALTPEEVLHLFHVIEDLRAADVGVIFVSHALEEALQISNRITVLRDGTLQVTKPAREMTRETIVRHMVGREVVQTIYSRDGHQEQSKSGTAMREVLAVENVTMGSVVKNMTFRAYAGEVLGIFGLVGAGRTEIAKIIWGALKRNRIHGGSILLSNTPIRYRVPAQALRDGIAYITEDRKRNGFFERLDIAENIYLGWLAKRKSWRSLVSRREKKEIAETWIKKLQIRAIDSNAKVVELSGGNQQKVVIAKSLVQDPSLVIFDEPTRGVDVATIAEIHQIIRDLARSGKAVIVISSYLPEVLALSDRILVARQGRIAAEFAHGEATAEEIMYAAVW